MRSNSLIQLLLLILVGSSPLHTAKGVLIRLPVVRHPADRHAVSTNTDPMLTITRLQRERLLRVVGVIKLPFNVRMLMISAALLLMEEYI